jgi:hypothetical protein
LIVSGFFLLLLIGLDAVPRSFGDESWYAAPTVEMLEHGAPRIPMVPGRGGIEHYFLQPKLHIGLHDLDMRVSRPAHVEAPA